MSSESVVRDVDVNSPDATVGAVQPKKHGRKQAQSMYLMTRVGFFKLCMSANGAKAKECRSPFATVYELALKFATNTI